MQKISFCKDWMFQSNENEKQEVLLPHDATQTQPRQADAPSGSGGAYYLGGQYTYSKTFPAPEEWRDQKVIVLFEGVYPEATVLLNGEIIGQHAYGYTQFEVELNPLKYGEENEIQVLISHNPPDSRWYAGAGIFRPVWLLTSGKNYIPEDGVKITTISLDPPTVRVQTAVEGHGNIQIEILDGNTVLAEGKGADAQIVLKNARLWDDQHPNLYRARVSLLDEDQLQDSFETAFGVRQLRYDTTGFYVNGRRVLLKGGCIHHDSGILGCRTFDEAEWRKISLLKKWGFNAVRSAHNPLSRAALEACDALGMYVMDELWDMWDLAKNPNDYAQKFPTHWQEDISAMVNKDYNHPSVILYSIGNEVTEPAKEEGVQLAAKIIEDLKRKDATRPVTAGINIALLVLAARGVGVDAVAGESQENVENVSSQDFNQMAQDMGQLMVMAAGTPEGDQVSTPVLDLLDIAGYNYGQARYEKDAELHPERVIVGTETFPHDLPSNWRMVENCPHVIGDFMWTAIDYIGEVGIGGWVQEQEEQSFSKPYPWKLGDTGALDILGNDTAEAGMAATVWGAIDHPYIGVRPITEKGPVWYSAIWRGTNAIPSWSWRGCEGKETEVEVYTRATEAELFLNGESLGRKAVEDDKAVFQVNYAPGELKAVVYQEGEVTGEHALISAQGDIHIALEPEGKPSQDGLLYVNISLQDKDGIVESFADRMLSVSVEGGELLAFGSADPKSEDSFLSGKYTTYYGRSQAVIRVIDREARITVQGNGLPSVSAVYERN